MTTNQANAILNSLYEKHAAHPGEWTAYDSTPPMRDAVTAGLIEHQENTRLYRITEKGVAAWHKLHGGKAAPQSEAPEVGEDALDNETARKDWVRSIYKQIDAEDAAELSVEPRTEAQPPTDLVGDGKRMPEKKRAPKAEPRTPGVIEALANLKVDELGPIEALTKLYELKRLATKEWTAEGVEFAGDDPLATADLVHQVEGLQTDLQAEKDRAAAQERQYQEQIAEMTVAWMADERAANAQITALGQAAADGQALMAAARVFADVIERAKKTPEATAPQSAAPYKVTNGTPTN